MSELAGPTSMRLKLFKYEPLFHVLFWFTALFYQYLKFLEGGQMVTPAHCFIELGFNMLPAYVLYLLILPNGRAWALMLTPVLFFSNALVYYNIDALFHAEDRQTWYVYFIHLIRHVSISLFFFALFAIKKLVRQKQEIKAISDKEQHAQLRLLKGQVNPHFLFNTLNTLYSSALAKDEATPELILKLSDNFRYVLHEGQENLVPIEKEIGHLKDYIHIQKSRLSDKIEVNWTEEIDDYRQSVPPMILISFVENAIKYSSMLTGQGHPINVHVKVHDQTLHFFCENTFSKAPQLNFDANWKKSGVGIKNTIKRLQFLYPDRHRLDIETFNSRYMVALQVSL